MPFSVPVVYLMNRVRVPSSAIEKAHSLSKVWWLRLSTYGVFGSLLATQYGTQPLIDRANLVNNQLDNYSLVFSGE